MNNPAFLDELLLAVKSLARYDLAQYEYDSPYMEQCGEGQFVDFRDVVAQISQARAQQARVAAADATDGSHFLDRPEMIVAPAQQDAAPAVSILRSAPASAQPADPDLFADEAKRLRRVVRALGMDKEVPEDDASLRECLFSVLGLIARKLEAGAQPDRGAAPSDTMDAERKAFGDYFCMTLSCDGSESEELINACRMAAEDAWMERARRAAPASQPVAPEAAQAYALHWPHGPTETACSSCGLTMGESRLLHDIKRGEAAVAPSDAKGKADDTPSDVDVALELAHRWKARANKAESLLAAEAGKADAANAGGLWTVTRLHYLGTVKDARGEFIARTYYREAKTLTDAHNATLSQSPATSAADAKDAEVGFYRRLSQQAQEDAMRERVRDAVAEALDGLYTCGRVWSAWSYGTMGQDDFAPAGEDDDVVDNITDAAIAAMAAAPSSEKGGA